MRRELCGWISPSKKDKAGCGCGARGVGHSADGWSTTRARSELWSRFEIRTARTLECLPPPVGAAEKRLSNRQSAAKLALALALALDGLSNEAMSA
eukprot:scaffold27325_cov243-Isochrysis_galbana.AAC.6